jgi:coiled-coil domain-containing protein 40
MLTRFLPPVQVSESENIKLDQKLDHFALILDKTEVDLEQTRSEGLLTKNHITKLFNRLERLAREKFELEEKILDLLSEQITTDKAGQHRGRLLREAQDERRNIDIETAQTENKLSLIVLELEKWRGNVQRAKDDVELMKKEHNEADEEVSTVNDEIEQLKQTAKKKLIQLNVLHKQLEQMIDQLGGREMNLKEVEIVDFEKKIADVDAKIKESQQFWLRLQSVVVSLSEKRAKQLDELFVGRKRERDN